MFELKYRIPVKDESRVTGKLVSSGTYSFAVEIVKNDAYVLIYSENEQPCKYIDPDHLESVTPIDLDELNNRWLESYRGAQLTENFYVKPPDLDISEISSGCIITINPADSFGDGCHATTRLCAVMLEDIISDIEPGKRGELSMLDIGTGSGVLAIEAGLLGVGEIELFDLHRKSVSRAEENLILNGFNNIRPFCADIYSYSFSKKYDLITANLLTGVIEDNLGKMAAGLKKDGALIISGIGSRWADGLSRMIIENGLTISRHEVLEDWHGYTISS